jgi:5-methylcytosine-specific restriction protein A
MPNKPSVYRPQKRATPLVQRATAAKRGYGSHWQRLRITVLNEEPLCRRCEAKGLTVEATDVDHITPRARGGTDDRSNLQALCHECHSAKTAKEDGGFGRTPVNKGT